MYVFDFKNCLSETKKISITPKGWIPIEVEYGLAQVNEFDTHTSVVWRVVGTTHTFHLYENQMNLYSHSNYAQHFTEVLEKFRQDYLSWWTDPQYEGCEWRDEYKNEFGRFIKEDSNIKS